MRADAVFESEHQEFVVGLNAKGFIISLNMKGFVVGLNIKRFIVGLNTKRFVVGLNIKRFVVSLNVNIHQLTRGTFSSTDPPRASLLFHGAGMGLSNTSSGLSELLNNLTSARG